MRIPRKRLKHIARPNPAIRPKSPTRLDALAAAACVLFPEEMPRGPGPVEDDDEVSESMAKKPALFKPSIDDSSSDDDEPAKPKCRKHLNNDLAKHSKHPLGATKIKHQKKCPGFEGVTDKPTKPAPTAGRSHLKQSVVASDFGCSAPVSVSPPKKKGRAKAKPKSTSKVQSVPPPLPVEMVPVLQIVQQVKVQTTTVRPTDAMVLRKAQKLMSQVDSKVQVQPAPKVQQVQVEPRHQPSRLAKSKSVAAAAVSAATIDIDDDVSDQSSFDMDSVFIDPSDIDYPKPPKVGQDLRQLHAEWCHYALASMKAKRCDRAEWVACCQSIADPKLLEYARRVSVENRRSHENKVHYDSIKTTKQMIKATCRNGQDCMEIDVDVDPLPKSDADESGSNSAVLSGMTMTIKSMPNAETKKKRKHRRTRKHKDSQLEFVINFPCMKEGHMLYLWPHKDCFEWLHQHRVMLHGEPQSHRLHELRCKVAKGDLTKPTFKWGKQKEPLIWSNSVITRKKNQLLKFIDEMNRCNEACWIYAPLVPGAESEMQRYKWVRICRDREQTVFGSALSVATR